MIFSMDPATQKAIKKFPQRASDIASSYEFRKVDAKQRLVFKLKQLQDNGTLPNPIERINIVGGWYGNVLIPLLDHHIVYNEINFYEIDELAIKISKIFYPKRINIKYINQDATTIVFSGNNQLTINTSCEHMVPLKIKRGYVALQSNNYSDIDDHLNCVKSSEELAEQYYVSKVWESSEKDYIDYKRYTVIGRV